MKIKSKTEKITSMNTQELMEALFVLYPLTTPAMLAYKDSNGRYVHTFSGSLRYVPQAIAEDLQLGSEPIKVEIEYHEDYFGMRTINWIGIYLKANTIKF